MLTLFGQVTVTHAPFDWERFGYLTLQTLFYVLLGLMLFALAFYVIQKVTPFSIRKEIEEDQNTALAVVIGSIILGIAYIVGSAIHG
jgi:putative membrane protein